jgi:UDP-N-acetylglucosamine/UDP-N-acetyl-alpha-D-glucosaminouronate 4-epimerase
LNTILVTGGAGFIGSYLVERLLDGGAAVRVLDNLSTGSLRNLHGAAHRDRGQAEASRDLAPEGRLEVVIGDIRDRELVRKATRNVDTVFHLAALPGVALGRIAPAELQAVNVQGTLNVLEGAVAEGVARLVFASSASVYGTPESLPVSESYPLRPESLFAASKLAAEMYCRTYGTMHPLDVVALRYFTVYGPRQHNATDGALIPELIETLLTHRSTLPHNDATAEDLTYVDDAVEATWAAAEAPGVGGQVINIGSGRMSSVLEILHLLYHLLKIPPHTGLRPSRMSAPSQVQAGITLAADLLGCTPRVSLAMGLARVVRALTEPEPIGGRLLAGAR